MKPSIGRIVHYKPTGGDRAAWSAHGNHIGEDDLLPAIIVAVWSDEYVNLRVFLDGTESPWATSATLGEGEHQWRWPARVGGAS
jgi:hypothetical protein